MVMSNLRVSVIFGGLTVLLMATCCDAFEMPTFAWEQMLNSTRREAAECVTGDEMGNVFVTGWTEGNMDTETNTTGNIFLAKLNSQGDVLWKRQFGPSRGMAVSAIATDKKGNCYLVGATNGAIEGINPAGADDAYIIKYGPEGTLLWVKLLGTTSDDNANAIAVDEDGNCYITGSTSGNLDSDPSTQRGVCAFTAKYDTDGTLIWVEQLRLNYMYEGKTISIQPDGTIHTAGRSGFMATYDPNGILVNSNRTSMSDYYGATFDHLSNLYTSGWTSSITAYVEKYNPSGSRLWRRQFRETGWTAPKYVVMCTDGSGDMLTGGCQQGPAGGNDCQTFLRRFNPDGTQTFRYDYMGGNSCGHRVGVDNAGACLLVGGRSGGNSAHIIKLSYPPYATAPIVLEAEAGDITQGTIIDCNESCTGTGLVQLDSAGSSIQWQANTITTGSHLLLLRYINGIQADATLDISINGRQAGTLTLPFTGNWNISLTLSTCVTLREGNNTIQIQTTSDTGPMIDCVNVICAQTNLATGKTIECSQEQPEHSAENATDLNLNTSWMAEGFPQCFEIDLGHVYDIDKTQIICDGSQAYQYRIDTRTCVCKQYETTVDQTNNQTPFSIASPRIDTFEPVQARYVRLTITGLAGEQEGDINIREFGVFPNF
jgi:hypothetical protein